MDGAPLSEIEVGRDGHFYNVQPPLPAILALPFVPFGAANEIEVFVSAVFGGLSIVPLFLALRALSVPRGLATACGYLRVAVTRASRTAASLSHRMYCSLARPEYRTNQQAMDQRTWPCDPVPLKAP